MDQGAQNLGQNVKLSIVHQSGYVLYFIYNTRLFQSALISQYVLLCALVGTDIDVWRLLVLRRAVFAMTCCLSQPAAVRACVQLCD
jgi:hypothetical protein